MKKFQMGNTNVPSSYRWLVLAIISLALCGNYFIYDIIPISGELLAEQLGFSNSQIGALQFWYSAINVVMVLIGGVIIDRIGTRASMLIFTIIFVIGAGITASQGTFLTMAVGRLVFGLGAESMINAVSAATSKWFRNSSMLSLAMSLQLTMGRVGTFAAENSPNWGNFLFDDWQKPLLFAVFVGIFSLVMCIAYFFIDRSGEKKFVLVNEKQDEIHLRDIFTFDRSFWYIVGICLMFYAASFPFKTFAPRFFMEMHGVNLHGAGVLASVMTFTTMILMPVFGGLIDKIGKRPTIMLISCIISIPAFLVMAYSRADVSISLFGANIPIVLLVCMFVLGLALSLMAATIWPCITMVVPANKVGTAFGMAGMIQNVGLMSLNGGIGYVNDVTGGYNVGMWIFAGLMLFGALFSLLLLHRDKGEHSCGLS
jgi:MFS family permease